MTCPECQYQWCWLCEGKYSSKHFEEGQCSGKQFIQADSLQQVREIEIERRNQRGGNSVERSNAMMIRNIPNWYVL